MAKRKKKQPTRLEDTLVLHRYLLHLFGVASFNELAIDLKDADLEGYDENNVAKLHSELIRKLPRPDKRTLTNVELQEYDLNIYTHTRNINAGRERPIHWKYFQYLALLFTEIYLDRFFRDRAGLLASLNEYLTEFNQANDLEIAPFSYGELNKLAFWNATGSGKTLLMHVNLEQYRHYQGRAGEGTVDRTLLVTPDEALSRQHIIELEESGLIAAAFRKDGGGLFTDSDRVEIIEITKIAETSGDKTVAVDAFESNNLVLIDEGHRGINGEQWKRMRDQLSQNGFAFEYSATFGQAVSAAKRAEKPVLLEEYGKSILFDYSYRFFYADGYGKEFRILNIGESVDQGAAQRTYLTGALLTFYQQKLLFATKREAVAAYLLEDPLWVFVGHSVNAVRTENKRKVSDVLTIIEFFSDFIKDPEKSRQDIHKILNGQAGLIGAEGRPIFSGSFPYLQEDAANVFTDILQRVFGGAVAGARLVIDKLGGTNGELGLRVGATENYFGVINIGDVSDFFKLAESQGVEVGEREFTTSLFDDINQPGSPINVLIGAKKFTTGWNSWRVSTMGLMRVGGGEGSTIIQLFGRGVRLKGYNFSLKRSQRLDSHVRPAIAPPAELPLLETLNIFGIRSDYMVQFKEYLKAEGIPTNDGNFQEISLPIEIPTVALEKAQLKILAPGEAADFRHAEQLQLVYKKFWEGKKPVQVDWFPRVQSFTLVEDANAEFTVALDPVVLTTEHLSLINWGGIYFQLQAYKTDKGYTNCYFDATTLRSIMEKGDFYDLFLPDAALKTSDFGSIRRRSEIVTALLKSYLDRFYKHHKSAYEAEHLKLRVLTPDHDNFYEQYQIEVERGQTQIVESLEKIKEVFSSFNRNAEEEVAPDFTVFSFMQHLYQPLIYLDNKQVSELVKISPIALNKGEYRFVQDLKEYYEAEALKKAESFFADRQLYLLRNRSRKGVGFFEANNFYPDFILWLVEGDFQYIVFVDPKGLRNINGLDNRKLSFYQTIGDTIEARLDDPDVCLDSYIISNTSYQDVKHWKGQSSIQDFNDRHVYFQKEQAGQYIELILKDIISSECEGRSR